MALTITQQILELIKKSNHTLIVCPKTWNIDCIASALGLSSILKKINKESLIVCDNFRPSQKIDFLPSLNQIKPNTSGLRKLIITLNLKNNKILDFAHQQNNNQLQIFITPQSQDFRPEDLSTNYSNFNFDLIITLNAQDLESLGDIYNQNTNFFYQTPIINIDHQPNNENYGQINLVGLKSTSVSEIIFKLASSWNQNLIDEHIATDLLAGIYNKTWSFRSNKITPETLSAAAQLINLGARREEIVYNLYQKKSLSSLKLWGKILENLKQKDYQKITWATIKHQDFLATSTTEKNLDGLIEELISTTPNSDIIFLLYEINQSTIGGIFYTSPKLNSLKIIQKYQPLGSAQDARFIIENTTLEQAEREIIEHLDNQLKSWIN